MSENLNHLKAAANAGDDSAQLQLGQHYLTQNHHSRARRWLQRSAAQGNLGARAELVLMEVFQVARPDAQALAIAQLKEIAAAGDGKANYYLACFHATGYAVSIDLTLALSHLKAALVAHYPAALRAYGLLLLLEDPTTNQVRAESFLHQAALAGDPYAPFACARLALAGGAGGLSVARYWLETAAQQSVELAGPAGNLAAGIAEPAKPPLAQEFALDIDSVRWPNFAANQVAYTDEIVYPINAMLPRVLCDYLINFTAPSMRASEVVNPKTGELMRNPVRTSSSTNADAIEPDLIMDFVCRYLCHLAGKSLPSAEALAVLRYRPGEEYRQHFDFFAPSAFERQPELSKGGQRDITALVYLNQVAAGGETVFPELDISLEPHPGAGVVFRNCDSQGEPLLKSLHAGKPVEEGEKWLLSQWFRREPIR